MMRGARRLTLLDAAQYIEENGAKCARGLKNERALYCPALMRAFNKTRGKLGWR